MIKLFVLALLILTILITFLLFIMVKRNTDRKLAVAFMFLFLATSSMAVFFEGSYSMPFIILAILCSVLTCVVVVKKR